MSFSDKVVLRCLRTKGRKGTQIGIINGGVLLLKLQSHCHVSRPTFYYVSET